MTETAFSVDGLEQWAETMTADAAPSWCDIRRGGVGW